LWPSFLPLPECKDYRCVPRGSFLTCTDCLLVTSNSIPAEVDCGKRSWKVRYGTRSAFCAYIFLNLFSKQVNTFSALCQGSHSNIAFIRYSKLS
jgi:hypothetical protein